MAGLKVLQPDGYFTLGLPPTLVAPDKPCEECGHRHDFEACPRCGAWIYEGYGIGAYRQWCRAECGWRFIRYDGDLSADLTCTRGRACAGAPGGSR